MSKSSKESCSRNFTFSLYEVRRTLLFVEQKTKNTKLFKVLLPNYSKAKKKHFISLLGQSIFSPWDLGARTLAALSFAR